MRVPFLFLLPCAALGCSHSEKVEPAKPAEQTEAVGKARVSVEQSIARACDVDTPRSFVELDSASLAASDDALERVADCLAHGKLKGRNIRIVGYNDLSHTERDDKHLSKARADAVASYLEAHGVERDKIIKSQRDERGRSDMAYERRVDIDLAD